MDPPVRTALPRQNSAQPIRTEPSGSGWLPKNPPQKKHQNGHGQAHPYRVSPAEPDLKRHRYSTKKQDGSKSPPKKLRPKPDKIQDGAL